MDREEYIEKYVERIQELSDLDDDAAKESAIASYEQFGGNADDPIEDVNNELSYWGE